MVIFTDNLDLRTRGVGPAAAEAIKKWDGGRSPRGGVWALLSFGGSGVLPPGNFFEIIRANLCNLVHFGDAAHQKWDGK